MSSSPITTTGRDPSDGTLLGVLGRVHDPRDRRGRRYPLAGVLAVAVCAVIAGARSFAAIGEWALDLSGDQLARLGLARAPEESTMRKLFARLDAAALDHQLSVLAWTRTRTVSGRRVIAIDGKTIRGARARKDPSAAMATAPHLIAALDHATGVVLGQHAVDAKSNEIPAVRDLLAAFDPADLHGSVVTLDAMHTQDQTANTILNAGAHYVFTIKNNGCSKRSRPCPGKTSRPEHEPPNDHTADAPRAPSRSWTSRRYPAGPSSPAPARSPSYAAPPPATARRASRWST